MSIRRLKPIYLLYCLLVILPIYQDSPLSKYLGAAGYAIAMPLSIIIYLLIVCFCQKGIIKRDEHTKGLFNLGKWLLVISFIGMVVWCLTGNSITVVGEFLPIKGIKVWLQYISYPMYVYSVLFCIKKMDNVEQMFKPIGIVLIILTILALIEGTQIPYAFKSIHFAGVFPYYRIRLLTMESSGTAVMILIYGGLAIYYALAYKRTIQCITYVACLGYLIFTSGSKSLLVSVAIVLMLYLIISGKQLKKSTIIGVLVVLICGVIFKEKLLPTLVQSFSRDVSDSTSVSTRLYTLIIGLGIGIIFPAGVGGAAYLGVFSGIMNKFLPLYGRLPIKFNLSEIKRYINSGSDVGLNVKSGILHFNMYWGILGTIYLMRIFFLAASRLNSRYIPYNEIIRAIFLTNVILLIFSANFQFEFWLLYAVVCGMNILSVGDKSYV